AYLLSQCTGKAPAPVAPKVEAPKVEAPKVETPAPVAAAPAPAPAATVEVPAGAGVLTWVSNSMPALKVYFDTGKTDVHSDWAAKSGELVSFLKANATAKAVISGFNDPTGNAAANAELSKNRAKAVAAALKAAGIEEGRVELRKPADTTAGAGASNAEARRVEVTIEK
ncbi:MAG: OmpA family protein, partial [Casimicrobium sp.]